MPKSLSMFSKPLLSSPTFSKSSTVPSTQMRSGSGSSKTRRFTLSRQISFTFSCHSATLRMISEPAAKAAIRPTRGSPASRATTAPIAAAMSATPIQAMADFQLALSMHAVYCGPSDIGGPALAMHEERDAAGEHAVGKSVDIDRPGLGYVPETVTVATMSICSPPARTNSAAGENATDQPGGSGCASRRWAARRAMPAAGSRAGLPVASGAGSGHVGGRGGGYASASRRKCRLPGASLRSGKPNTAGDASFFTSTFSWPRLFAGSASSSQNRPTWIQ